MNTFIIKSINDYNKICKYIIEKKNFKVILLNGDLGSGKTTFVQFLCKKIGVKDKVLSPTFNLVNEYSINKNKKKIYHFDLYRVKEISELIEIDFIDFIDSGNYCFIEWPNICKGLIDFDFIELNFKIISEMKREIKII